LAEGSGKPAGSNPGKAPRPHPTRTEYEIDLNSEHAQALRDALARYISASRRVSGARRPVRSGRGAPVNGVNTTEIREWAKAQGIEVKDRGRVPAELVVKFKAATAG